MPVIPQFQSGERYDAAPLPSESPSAAAQTGNALAEGMNRVSAQFAEVHRAATLQDLASKGVAIDTTHAKAMVDLRTQFESDPDPATVPARFQAATQALQDKTLGEIQDPSLKAYVQRNILQREPAFYATVAQAAAHGVKQAAMGTATAAVSDQAKLLADAPNAAEQTLAVQGIKQAAGSVLATGAVTPEQARMMVSKSFAEAILIRATKDVPGATTMLAQLKPEMDAGHVLQAETALRAAGIDAQGAAIADRKIAAVTGAPVAIPQVVRERAQAVHDGFVKLGWSDAAAWGWAANAVQESGARADAPTGDGGISHGLFQWNKERHAAFRAKYGVDPEQAPLEQQIQFAHDEAGGSERVAGAAIRTAATPDDAAKIISTKFLRPKDTAAEEPRRAGIARTLAGLPRIEPGQMLQEILDETKGNPQLQAAALRHMQTQIAVQRAGEVDADRQQRQQEREQRMAAEASGNKITTAILSDPTKVDPLAIANDPNLSWETKIRLNDVLKRALHTDDGKDVKTYGPGFWDAYQAVHAPEGDPRRITDAAALYGRGGPGGDLTVAGIDKLSAEISGRRSPEGEAEATMKKQFLAMAHSQLSGTNELLHMKDPKGEEIFLRFMATALPAYDTGRKAGKPAAALLSPDSPDYIGKGIGAMKRPLAVQMRDMMDAGGEAGALPQAKTDEALDLTTREGVQKAVRDKRLPIEEGTRIAIERGWIRAAPPPAAAPAAQPQPSLR